MALVFMVHQFFRVVLDMQQRDFRLPFFIGALAASVLIAAHGAPLHHTEKRSTELKTILKHLRSCQSRTDARFKGIPSDDIRSRTMCSSRISFDYDRFRLPENLTTVECSCQGQLCLPIGDYRCTTIRHRFPVEYKNGTRADIELPVACACAASRINSAHTGQHRIS